MIEVFGPGKEWFSQVITEMYDYETGLQLDSAPHAQQVLRIKLDKDAGAGWLLRKKIDQ